MLAPDQDIERGQSKHVLLTPRHGGREHDWDEWRESEGQHGRHEGGKHGGHGWHGWHDGQQGGSYSWGGSSGSGGGQAAVEMAVEDEEGWLDEGGEDEVEEEDAEADVHDAVAEAAEVARAFVEWGDMDVVAALEDQLSTAYARRTDVDPDTMTVSAPSKTLKVATTTTTKRRRGTSHRAGRLLVKRYYQ